MVSYNLEKQIYYSRPIQIMPPKSYSMAMVIIVEDVEECSPRSVIPLRGWSVNFITCGECVSVHISNLCTDLRR